jgi:hypothetical protein
MTSIYFKGPAFGHYPLTVDQVVQNTNNQLDNNSPHISQVRIVTRNGEQGLEYTQDHITATVTDALLEVKQLRKYDLIIKLLASLPIVALIVGIARIAFALLSTDEEYRFEDRKLHILRGALEIAHLALILNIVDLILDLTRPSEENLARS